MERTWHYLFAFRLLLLLVIIFQILCPATSFTSLATDQSALLTLKARIISDPHQVVTSNWTNSSSVCSWIGVTCSSRHYRVAQLDISHMDITGTIPPQLGNLSFLLVLNLSYNHFSGNLPQELSRLHRLKFFTTLANNLSGKIPSWLGLLTRLEFLSLRNNSFSGFIPTSISNLSNLEVLDFSFNSIEGIIPEELGSLGSLKSLIIQSNNLLGPIQPTLFNASALEIIALMSNELNGNLPINICSHVPFLKRISVSFNEMSGQIPPSLSECSQLQSLSLSYNHFSGQIPEEIGKLQNLRTLHLGGNNLTGVIPPNIGNLHNLVDFGMEANMITGAIPPSIFNISSLQRILMQDNYLTGSLPRQIGNLTILNSLFLSKNNLTGVLPHEVTQLHHLEELSMAYNNLTGTIQKELFNMSFLQILSLSATGMVGSFPPRICTDDSLPVLEILLLDENSLSGEIPHSFSNCSNLRTLSLNINQFTGFMPHSLGNLRLIERLQLGSNNLRNEPSSLELSFIGSLANCKFLSQLGIDGNPLHGIILASIGNLSTSLQVFNAFNCKIKGVMPAEIGNLSKLVALRLGDNELTGEIPFTVKHMLELQGLHLRNNKIGGSLENLCNLPSLNNLQISQNQFSGPIPQCLGTVTALRVLSLDSNMLASSIPSSLWDLTDLLAIDLSSNSLSGFLAPEIGNLVKLDYINFSMNKLSGYIPSTIGNLQNLGRLLLGHNELQGSIPMSMGKMISLGMLDLSHNNLSGSIPKSLEALQELTFFDVSFNSLTGEIPSNGPFRSFTSEFFKANKALCGSVQFHVPPCRKHGSKWKNVRLVLFIFFGVTAFITIVSLACLFKVRNKRKDKEASGFDTLTPTIPDRISYYELLRATEQFDESNLLGMGSFGSVYKGDFGEGKILAVKVFNLQLEDAFKSFDVECEVLRGIRHRNLTKVIGSCSNDEFKALVLEYMPNGNLEKWLHSHNYSLNVKQRLNIMIDVASALEYLHHGYSSPIVHCDLKPSNVLLDDEMTARISDFGIAKLLGKDESIMHTNTLATLGYIAPEYGLEGLVSIRCDVYSYGIMLMETFTRKRPSDEMFVGDVSLKSWVQGLLPASVDQVIDSNLLCSQNENFDEILHCVSHVLEVAMKCTAESPVVRINMKEAVAELQKIRSRFLA